MPNWTDCRVTITHAKPEKIDQLILILNDKDPFNQIVPMPSLVSLEEVYNGSLPEWYGWRCENWGTKWEPQIEELERPDSQTIDCNMLTAWSPPTRIWDTLYDLGFRVEAVYLDEGWCYCGHYQDKADQQYEVDPADLPEKIEQVFGDIIRTIQEEQMP